MSGWQNLPTDDQKEWDHEHMPVDPMPEPPKPIIETKLVDLASEAESPKTYLAQGERKNFEEKRDKSDKMNTPVDVYEPGFRTDLYEGLIKFFRDKRKRTDQLDRLRQKIGLRG